MPDTETTIGVKVVQGSTSAVLPFLAINNGTVYAFETAIRADGSFVSTAHPLPTGPAQRVYTGENTTPIITTGGAAVAAIVGPVSGGYIVNPSDPLDQGIVTAEDLYVDPAMAPGVTPGDGNGTTSRLYPGGSFVLPAGLAAGQTLWANGATSGHKFGVVVW